MIEGTPEGVGTPAERRAQDRIPRQEHPHHRGDSSPARPRRPLPEQAWPAGWEASAASATSKIPRLA